MSFRPANQLADQLTESHSSGQIAIEGQTPALARQKTPGPASNNSLLAGLFARSCTNSLGYLLNALLQVFNVLDCVAELICWTLEAAELLLVGHLLALVAKRNPLFWCLNKLS